MRHAFLMTVALATLAFWISGCAEPRAAVPGDRVTQEWVEQLRDEVLVALEKGAQITLPEPVEIVVLTASEAKTRRAAYAETMDENRGLTAAVDLFADMVFSDRMLGRYLPDEKVIYVISNVVESYARGGGLEAVEDLLFAVMAHEVVHAYDDQVYDVVPVPADIYSIMDDGGALPDVHTLMSLLEGRATYAAELASVAAERKPMDAPTMDDVKRMKAIPSNDGVGGAAAGAMNFVARTKMVQYVQGRAFAVDAYRFGGEKFFNHVFASLPLSMGELESFEAFRQRWAEDLLAALDAEEDAESDIEVGAP